MFVLFKYWFRGDFWDICCSKTVVMDQFVTCAAPTYLTCGDLCDLLQAAVSISQGNNHKLQFVINDHVLPYNMTVFQAIQQFSQDPSDSDSEMTVGSTHLFQRTHTIYYRSVAAG